MKKFRVTHVVLCEVNCYRTISAETYEKAMEQLAAIECYSGASEADFEIVSDIEVKHLTVTEIK